MVVLRVLLGWGHPVADRVVQRRGAEATVLGHIVSIGQLLGTVLVEPAPVDLTLFKGQAACLGQAWVLPMLCLQQLLLL